MPRAIVALAVVVRSCRATVLALVGAILLVRPIAAQTDPAEEPRTRIRVEFASEALRRNTGLATALTIATNRAADAGMDRLFGRTEGKTKGAILKRLARVYVVNLPIAALGNFAAHELGHVTRAHETGTALHDFQITRWLWPTPITGGLLYGDIADNGFEDLSITAGGAEGA